MIRKNDKYALIFEVSKKIYKGFVQIFNDRNPLHTDDDFARKNGFKRKVMHGNILNGFLSYFIGECLPNKSVVIHTQEIQYNNPVYLNDILSFEAKVVDIFESVGVIEFKYTFKNRNNEIVAKGKIQIGLLG